MSAEATQRLEIRGDMTRSQAEALQLEIRRLAKQHDVRVERVAVQRAPEDG